MENALNQLIKEKECYSTFKLRYRAASKKMIYSSISEMLAGKDVYVRSTNVNTQTTFSSEEDIRNI